MKGLTEMMMEEETVIGCFVFLSCVRVCGELLRLDERMLVLENVSDVYSVTES